MSLYNMIMGVNPCTFFILPMLGRHAEEYPRFRDCHLSSEDHPEYDDHIHVYTRMGGGNRGCWNEDNDGSPCKCTGCTMENLTKEDENFVTSFDDSYDSTYATYVFKVPEKWKSDFDKIKEGNIGSISKEYKEELYKVYPKAKDKFDKMFNIYKDYGQRKNTKNN